jgi:hypothetical protein
MTYSKTHQRFADHLNNQRALEHPEEFLGPNWKDVLNFWWFLDGLSNNQLGSIRFRYLRLPNKIGYTTKNNHYGEALRASYDFCPHDYIREAISKATAEIIGSHNILSKRSVIYLPLFINL